MLRTIPITRPRQSGSMPGLRPRSLGATTTYSNTERTQAGVDLQNIINTTITSLQRVGGGKYPPINVDGKVGYTTCNAIAWLVRNNYWINAGQYVTDMASFSAICSKESIDPNWMPGKAAPVKPSGGGSTTSTTTTTTTTTTTPPASTASKGSGGLMAVLIGGGLGLGALALFAASQKKHHRSRSRRRR